MTKQKEVMVKLSWQCRWFGHDWTTFVGFPMKRKCERCGSAERGRDDGLPTRWIKDDD